MRLATLLAALLALAAAAVSCSDGSKAEPTATPAPTATVPPSPQPTLTPYTNAEFKVQLQYPVDWVPDPQYAANIGGGVDEMYRDARGREYGFFQVNAANAPGTLDDVAQGEANHLLKPFGEHPEIERVTVGGKEARLILPESSAPEPFTAELIVPYQASLFIAGSTYSFLIIYGHVDFIRGIAATMAVTG